MSEICPVPRLDPIQSALLVIDFQERLIPAINGKTSLKSRIHRLVRGANALKIPVIVTEQYNKGMGATDPSMSRDLEQAYARHDKMQLTAAVPPLLDDLKKLDTKSVLVSGIEAHICIMRTCLDLIDVGYTVGLITDAIGSRRQSDKEVAIRRMMAAGALPMTVESALLELEPDASSPRYRDLMSALK